MNEAVLLEGFMREALHEGRKALPACRPNPPVGCVIVRDGVVIARGHTQPPGQPHAEAGALSRVAGDLSDTAVFVTLEPCSFRQRTPSSAKALIRAGVRAVYVAMLDPDPRNAGKGIEMLRAGGLEVTVGLCEAEAHAELDPYIWRLNGPADVQTG